MSLEEGLNLVLEVGREAARSFPCADAISVPGRAALCLHEIAALEGEFDKPAFTHLNTEVWNDLLSPGVIPPIQGWCRLLAGGAQ